MEMSSIIAGLIAGLAIATVVFYLLNKVKYVSKSTYEAQALKLNETTTLLKVTEDRLINQQQDFAKLNLKLDLKESELALLQSKSASLETIVAGSGQKNNELVQQLTEKTMLANVLQEEINTLKQAISERNAIHQSLTANLDFYKNISQNQTVQLEQLTEKLNTISSENSRLAAQHTALTDKLSTQKEEITTLQQTAHFQFEKIANQIFEEKSGRFTETNKTNMEALLKPLGENIDLFKKKVEETYDKESKQRFSLEEKVRELIEQTNKVSSEANNLATALKGQAKKQGDWGEMILESILQKSGLVKDREYFLQKNIKDDEGKNLRPDVLVHLPDERIIIIDSKVSLIAYDRFSSAETTDEQAIHLAGHLKSIYGHIDDLHEKKYDNIEASLDFTMMFVPVEPAYMIAIQGDQELWAYAYSKRILLISPTNLIACLKLIADLWKREMQSKNALEIVKRGELLYEKFVSFSESMEDIGKHINRSQAVYNNAIAQLKTGSGNLVGQALKLKSLGLKSSKAIPAGMTPDDGEDLTNDPSPQTAGGAGV